MTKFNENLNSDDFASDREEWEQLQAYLANELIEYDWSEEAIDWEEGFHPDNLYDQDEYYDDDWPTSYDDDGLEDEDDWDHGQYDEY